MSDTEKKRQKKPKSKTRKILEWVLTGFFLVLFAIIGFAQIDGMVHKKDHYGQLIRFGFSNYVVQTESMEPKYMKNTAIIDYLEDVDKIYARYQRGEEINVTFMDVYSTRNEFTNPENNPQLTQRTSATNVPMTHQIKEIHVNNAAKKGEGKYYFITAGINTPLKHFASSNTHQVWISRSRTNNFDMALLFTEVFVVNGKGCCPVLSFHFWDNQFAIVCTKDSSCLTDRWRTHMLLNRFTGIGHLDFGKLLSSIEHEFFV